MGNAELVTQLLLGLLQRAASIAILIRTAQQQGRDVTAAELDAMAAADDTAKAGLDAAIKAARAVSA